MEISLLCDCILLVGKLDNDGVKDEDVIYIFVDGDVFVSKMEVDNRDSLLISEGVVEGGKKLNKDEKGDEDED